MAALETKKLAEQLGTTEEMVMKLQKLAAIKHIDPESLFGALGRTETFMRAAVGGEEVSEELAEKAQQRAAEELATLDKSAERKRKHLQQERSRLQSHGHDTRKVRQAEMELDEDVASKKEKIAATLDAALSKGDNKKLAILKSLHLGMEDIAGPTANATKVMLAFGKALEGNATLEQRQAGHEIFGRGGSRITNALKDLERTAPTFTTEQQENLVKAAEAWERIEKTTMRYMKLGVANAINALVKDFHTWAERIDTVNQKIEKLFGVKLKPAWEESEEINPKDMEAGIFDMKTGKFTPREFEAPGEGKSGEGGIFDSNTGEFLPFGQKDKTRGAGTGMQALATFFDQPARKKTKYDESSYVGTVASEPDVASVKQFHSKSITVQEQMAKSLVDISSKLDDQTDY